MGQHTNTKKQQREKDRKDWEHLSKNPVNNFVCRTCDPTGKTVYTQTEFTQHLREAHKIDPVKMKARRQMMMHLDGSYWFQSQYHWTVPIEENNTNVEFDQSIYMARKNFNDFMNMP